jgi:hypothetical protein
MNHAGDDLVGLALAHDKKCNSDPHQLRYLLINASNTGESRSHDNILNSPSLAYLRLLGRLVPLT